LKQGKSATEKY
jgi:serine/threonine protein kinase